MIIYYLGDALCSGRVQWHAERGEKEGYGEGEETRKYRKTGEQAITFLFDKIRWTYK